MYRVQIIHLHEGNSTPSQRYNSKYMTLAKLIDDRGIVLHTATARCCPNDAPSRKTGRALAISRVLESEFVKPGTYVRVL